MQTRTIAALALSAVIMPAIVFAQGNGNGRANGQRDEQTQMRFGEMDSDHDGVIIRAEWRGEHAVVSRTRRQP